MKLVVVAGIALALALAMIALGRSNESYNMKAIADGNSAWHKFNDISSTPWL